VRTMVGGTRGLREVAKNSAKHGGVNKHRISKGGPGAPVGVYALSSATESGRGIRERLRAEEKNVVGRVIPIEKETPQIGKTEPRPWSETKCVGPTWEKVWKVGLGKTLQTEKTQTRPGFQNQTRHSPGPRKWKVSCWPVRHPGEKNRPC